MRAPPSTTTCASIMVCLSATHPHARSPYYTPASPSFHPSISSVGLFPVSVSVLPRSFRLFLHVLDSPSLDLTRRGASFCYSFSVSVLFLDPISVCPLLSPVIDRVSPLRSLLPLPCLFCHFLLPFDSRPVVSRLGSSCYLVSLHSLLPCPFSVCCMYLCTLLSLFVPRNQRHIPCMCSRTREQERERDLRPRTPLRHEASERSLFEAFK